MRNRWVTMYYGEEKLQEIRESHLIVELKESDIWNQRV